VPEVTHRHGVVTAGEGIPLWLTPKEVRMIRTARRVRPTAAAVGLTLGTAAIVATGTAQAETAAPAPAAGAVAVVQPNPALQVDLSALVAPVVDTPGRAVADTKPPTHATGDLPGGRAVPMKDFRVGPLYGRVGGPHTGGVHSGLDMGADQGEPINAIAPGRVEVAGWQGAAGKAVTIVTASGKRILYGHMSRIGVQQGQRVEAGERIGAVGSTGNSTGPHLHLGVNRPTGESMDPLIWLGISDQGLAKRGRD
jgi:murein DD-endopeptidase MepM/ murein hydrolase activator NlpD